MAAMEVFVHLCYPNSNKVITYDGLHDIEHTIVLFFSL